MKRRSLFDYNLVPFDIETSNGRGEGSLNERDGFIALMQIKLPGEEPQIIDPMEGDSKEKFDYVRRILSDPDNLIIGHNLKFDYRWLAYHGIYIKNPFDTVVASQLYYAGLTTPDQASKDVTRARKVYSKDSDLEPIFSNYTSMLNYSVIKSSRMVHSFAAAMLRELGIEISKIEQTSDWSRRPLSAEQLEYALWDVRETDRLAKVLYEKLQSVGLEETFWLEMDVQPALAFKEMVGIKVDKEAWTKQTQELNAELIVDRRNLEIELGTRLTLESGELQQGLFGLMPTPVNLNSPTMAQHLGLPNVQAATLQEYQDEDPFILKFMDYKVKQKMASTYGSTYLDRIEDGRLRSNFSQTQTSTGRLCIAKGTKVTVDRGGNPEYIAIQDIKEGDLVYTFDDENLKLTTRKVVWAGKTGHKEVVRLHWGFDEGALEGSYLDLTPEHRVRLTDGTYKEAGDLVKGVDLLSYPHGARVTKVTKLKDMVDVYDLEVEETHNFIANSICVHNSSSKPNLQNCYSGDTQVLTEANGWVRFDRLNELTNYKVAQYNTDGTVTFVQPDAYIRKHFKGDMLHIASDDYDFLVTPDHRMLVEDVETKELSDILAQDWVGGKNIILAGGNRGSTDDAVITKVPHDSDVYCLTVPSSYLVVKRKNKSAVAGNCPPTHIKSMIRSRKGYIGVAADYSTVELRILAYISGDENFIRACEAQDMHSANARMLFHIPENEPVPRAIRNKSKIGSFAVPYGTSPFGLYARGIVESVAEGQDFIDRFFNMYPKVHQFLRDGARNASVHGMTRDAIGRIRRYEIPPQPIDYSYKREQFKAIRDNLTNLEIDFRVLMEASTYEDAVQGFEGLDLLCTRQDFHLLKEVFYYERKLGSLRREGQNMAIQASSASITKRALGDAYQFLRDTGYGMITLSIHDSIFYELREDYFKYSCPSIIKIMEDAGPKIVPNIITPVDLDVGYLVKVPFTDEDGNERSEHVFNMKVDEDYNVSYRTTEELVQAAMEA